METRWLESDHFFCRMLLRSTLCVQNWVKLCWTGHRGAPQTRHSSPSKVFTLPLIICLQLRHMRTLHLHLKVGSWSRCVPATYFYPGRLSQPLRSIAFWETRMISLAPPFAEDPLPIGVNDTQIDSIQYLNFAKKWFNSIFNSILFHKNSIQKII